jgi:hypothetical protein
MNAHRLAVAEFLARGVPADQAELFARDMTQFARVLLREAARQEQAEAQSQAASQQTKRAGECRQHSPRPTTDPYPNHLKDTKAMHQNQAPPTSLALCSTTRRGKSTVAIMESGDN